MPIFKLVNHEKILQPNMKISLSHAQCPMPHTHFPTSTYQS
ncbi:MULTISPECIES: hypothetical protein [Calothrix]|nr:MULTISPECIES: hypothetical protein [Calothrix]